MRLEELDAVCRQAARDLLAREGRPLRPAVVLPLPDATRVASLPDFPDDDPSRAALMARFAADVMAPANAPAFGFLAEGAVGDVEVVTVVYGARNHRPHITAAALEGEGLGEFSAPEELDDAAFPFLHPLRLAVDAAVAPDVFRP